MKTGKQKLTSLIFFLITLAMSMTLMIVTSAVATTSTIEVSQPVQLTDNSFYERGQSIVYDGTFYWLFYGRSATVTGSYDTQNPDVNDYKVYYKKAGSISDLAATTATQLSGANNSDGYLGETGAAYFAGDVWAFATIDVGSSADLYGWWTDDGGANWYEVGPIITGLSDGQAHHDEVAYNGELWVIEGSGNFETKHSATPKTGGWSTPLNVGALTGGLAHFFVDGVDLYLAINSAGINYIYKYDDSVTPEWDLIDSDAPPNKYDPTLFKVGSDYVFAQAPWVSPKQYLIAWSGSTLDGTFFDVEYRMVTAGEYGSNPWVDMWPIGFTDAGGTSYLFYTSERNLNDPASEIDGNIWYLEVDWDIKNNDHYTYIKNAVDEATSTTIYVAAGTYYEGPQIVIDGNLSIIGEDRGTTIIRPTADTGSSGDARGWFLVTDGVEFHLSNFTLDGTSHLIYQAIRHRGHGSIVNVDFTDIKYPPYAGLAVVPYGTGAVHISNCTFTEIGRVGVLYFGSGVNGSMFSNNVYTGKGVGDWLDYGVEAGAGANVEVANNTISGNRGVASSDGSTSAGILVTTYYGSGTGATVTNNTLTDNTTGIAVGYDGDDTSTVVAHYNEIFGNDYGVESTAPCVDATLNWWGDVSGPDDDLEDTCDEYSYNPDGLGNAVSVNVYYDPWIGQGGFVTGGGTIWSDAGDFAWNPSAEGQATFGFVSKYKKGANVPEGHTNFVFQAGSLHFTSSEYDWLVVAGDTARFKGTGTIAGAEGIYKFMCWAEDDDPDTFRIKIWEEVDGIEEVAYDNGAQEPITGGNIFINKKKS